MYEHIVKAAREAGDELPDNIKNAPLLKVENMFFWECFWDLGRDRPVGMSTGSIPWSSIYNYCKLHELNSDSSRFVIDIIKRVDDYYLSYIDNKNKVEMSKNKRKK